MKLANLQILVARHEANPFVCEVRDSIMWVSDKHGTFELEHILGDDEWMRIVVLHEGGFYEADVNIYESEGGYKCAIYALYMDDGYIHTDGTDCVSIPIKK